jgi:hypothetical protein
MADTFGYLDDDEPVKPKSEQERKALQDFLENQKKDNYAAGQGNNVTPGGPGSYTDPSGKHVNEMTPGEIRDEFARRAKEKKENPHAGK